MVYRVTKYIPVILAFLAVTFIGCQETMVLEYEDLLTPEIAEARRDGILYLEISGHCGHSALAVDKTVSQKKIDGLHVYTNLVLVHEGRRSGALEYRVAVPEDVRRVFFGKKEKIIWERK